MHSMTMTADGDLREHATSTARVVGYLCDPSAVAGADVLFGQLRQLEGYAGRSLDDLYVDSGRPNGPAACGYGLMGLVADAEVLAIAAVVVASASVLGPDEGLAAEALRRLLAAGLAVHEASSGRVHSTTATLCGLAPSVFEAPPSPGFVGAPPVAGVEP